MRIRVSLQPVKTASGSLRAAVTAERMGGRPHEVQLAYDRQGCGWQLDCDV